MFTFKKFSIQQDRTAMKVGTDGVLIGAWAKIDNDCQNILDIGTGTGLIALMMAQRSNAKIDAVEIDTQSAYQATENIEKSIWSQRVKIHNIDIYDFNNSIKYDLIISNPPFFINSLHSPNKSRTIARHTTTLTFTKLLDSVERLLSSKGKFTLILPPTETEILDQEINHSNKLHLSRRCFIKSRYNSSNVRIMSEYCMQQTANIEYHDLAIRKDNSNDYTQEYIDLTADFYLKF